MHGVEDEMIPIEYAEKTYQDLIKNKNVQFHKIDNLSHSLCLEEVILLK
jgi:hypothetical protein